MLRTEGRVTMIDGILAGSPAGPGPERRPGLVVGRPRRRVRAALLRRPRSPGNLLHPRL